MLTNLLIFSLVCVGNAFAIIAFNRAASFDVDSDGKIIEPTKMILWMLKFYSEKWLGYFWSKPIYSCPTCMASIHGLIPFLILEYNINGFDINSLYRWAFYTLALSGLTTFINER